MNTLSSNKISLVHARQVFDSRGRPTVEVDVHLENGAMGRACAPSGASTGRHEAHELRDADESLYEGRGVLTAVRNVNVELNRALCGMDVTQQLVIDRRMRELDGTPQLVRLGGNAVLATSLAVCRAAASAVRMPLYRYIAGLAGVKQPTLPMPMVNILSGGAHAAQSMDFQDFLAVPIAAQTFSEAMKMVSQVRRAAERVMSRQSLPVFLADEGGLSPGLKNAHAALDMMVASFEEAGLRPGEDIAIAIDVAASQLFKTGSYELNGEGRQLSSAEMISMISDCVKKYPVISVEDALDQDDWENWKTLMSALPSTQIVGDDFFATNVSRIAQGIEQSAANSVLIKVNQNGTLSGTLEAIAVARKANFATVVSARSGETEDSFIADLAVGTAAGQIKIGSVRTSERLSKYNQLIRIEEDDSVPFAGSSLIAGNSFAYAS